MADKEPSSLASRNMFTPFSGLYIGFLMPGLISDNIYSQARLTLDSISFFSMAFLYHTSAFKKSLSNPYLTRE